MLKVILISAAIIAGNAGGAFAIVSAGEARAVAAASSENAASDCLREHSRLGHPEWVRICYDACEASARPSDCYRVLQEAIFGRRNWPGA